MRDCYALVEHVYDVVHRDKCPFVIIARPFSRETASVLYELNAAVILCILVLHVRT